MLSEEVYIPGQKGNIPKKWLVLSRFLCKGKAAFVVQRQVVKGDIPFICMCNIQINNLVGIKEGLRMEKNQSKDCIEWRGKKFSYFSHTKCEYFPCHGRDEENFNCLFCYCPLYEYDDCGGNFVYWGNGCKDCSACLLPHRKEDYGRIVKFLREKREEHGK